MVTYREVRAPSVAENIMVYGIGFSSGCGQSPGQLAAHGFRAARSISDVGLGRTAAPSSGHGRLSRDRDRRCTGPGDGGTGRYPSPADAGPLVPCQEAGPDPELRELANVGGGGYFELTNADDLGATFARVADELHQQYLLAFSPEKLDGEVHKLEVRVRNSEPHREGETELRGFGRLIRRPVPTI